MEEKPVIEFPVDDYPIKVIGTAAGYRNPRDRLHSPHTFPIAIPLENRFQPVRIWPLPLDKSLVNRAVARATKLPPLHQLGCPGARCGISQHRTQ